MPAPPVTVGAVLISFNSENHLTFSEQTVVRSEIHLNLAENTVVFSEIHVDMAEQTPVCSEKVR